MVTVISAAVTAVGVVVVAVISAVQGKLTARSESAVAMTNIKVQADNNLIDQLQEELRGYRAVNDQRVANLEIQVSLLERENRGYRAFIGVQRDHMAAHGIPLPPWPEDLPR